MSYHENNDGIQKTLKKKKNKKKKKKKKKKKNERNTSGLSYLGSR